MTKRTSLLERPALGPAAAETASTADPPVHVAEATVCLRCARSTRPRAALDVFGIGWVWVTTGRGGGLAIETTANQDTRYRPAVKLARGSMRRFSLRD
jgi:hypothetical protein